MYRRLLDDVRKKAEQNSSVKITVTGDITREELNKLYADAHLLILPSSSESFPKVVAEAAAYGCIPVTTSLSAITRQITDGVNGFLMKDNSPGSITQTINRVAAHTSIMGDAAMQYHIQSCLSDTTAASVIINITAHTAVTSNGT